MRRTPKARALGASLRQSREERGLSLRALAKEVNRDIAQLSRWETGEQVPKPEQVAQILTALGVNGERFENIINLSYGTREPLWVATSLPERRRQMDALLDSEQGASKITSVSPLLVPGLLQTANYIRAMMEEGGVPIGELASRVATRIGRTAILKRTPNPVQLVAFVGYGALHQMIRSWDIVLEQLRFLQEAAHWPNISLRVIPYDRGWHPALEGPFTVIESEKATPIVHLENRRSGLFLHEDDDVKAYLDATINMTHVALDPHDSVTVIANLIEQVEKKGMTPEIQWQKATRSVNTDNCVEVSTALNEIRDSKNPNGPTLRFTPAAFAAFVRAAKVGRFDRLE